MHTNKTTNYNLPLFTTLDKPTILGDFNGAMTAIDAGMHANQETGQRAQTTADTALNNVETALTNSNDALVKANTAIEDATQAHNDAIAATSTAGDALNLAQSLASDITDANNTANQAKTIAEGAGDEVSELSDIVTAHGTRIDDLETTQEGHTTKINNLITYTGINETLDGGLGDNLTQAANALLSMVSGAGKEIALDSLYYKDDSADITTTQVTAGEWVNWYRGQVDFTRSYTDFGRDADYNVYLVRVGLLEHNLSDVFVFAMPAQNTLAFRNTNLNTAMSDFNYNFVNITPIYPNKNGMIIYRLTRDKNQTYSDVANCVIKQVWGIANLGFGIPS